MIYMYFSSRTIIESRMFRQILTRHFSSKGGYGRAYEQMNNQPLFLMGSPGSGKTTVGRILSSKLSKPVLDVDNDILEPSWNMPVSQKLVECGADGFLQAEGEAVLSHLAHDIPDAIISLSGSNPLHGETMKKIKEAGIVVFLDVVSQDIVKRQGNMKVDRIVGKGCNLSEVLEYRQQFYEGNYDIRVICEEGETAKNIADKVIKSLQHYQFQQLGHVSTRDVEHRNPTGPSFNEVVLQGLAPDGGLYVPRKLPEKFTLQQWTRFTDLPYQKMAALLLEKWINPNDIHPAVLSNMVNQAYSTDNFPNKDVFQLRELHNGLHLTELFTGPTASFKDAALQLMPRFFEHAKQKLTPNAKHLIIVATSGDTGGAVLDGFGKLDDEGVGVVVLYPEIGISPIQKAQMTSASGKNVHVLGVKSDFDFCQSFVKKLFNDKPFCQQIKEKHNIFLSSANSINFGRLIPQIVYHVYSYLQLVKKGVLNLGEPADITIPTGNFGNLLCAYYAKLLGIPFRRLICASNRNNVLTEFINTGLYDLSHRKLQCTSSPAIDILKSSNLERLIHHLSPENPTFSQLFITELEKHKGFQVDENLVQKIRSTFSAGFCTEEDCLDTIKNVNNKTGYIIDPHTSVAVTVAKRFQHDHVPMLVASTAHPGKFAPDVLKAMDIPLFGGEKLEQLVKLLGTYGENGPKEHKSLIHSITSDQLHSLVCEADAISLTNRILNVCDNMKSLK